jgi:hypothetical protein
LLNFEDYSMMILIGDLSNNSPWSTFYQLIGAKHKIARIRNKTVVGKVLSRCVGCEGRMGVQGYVLAIQSKRAEVDLPFETGIGAVYSY